MLLFELICSFVHFHFVMTFWVCTLLLTILELCRFTGYVAFDFFISLCLCKFQDNALKHTKIAFFAIFSLPTLIASHVPS